MDKPLEFLRKRDYIDKGPLGQGGLGEARLIFDDVINELLVCKKYAPVFEEHKEKYFKNFIDEIKLLHLAFHRNIVRVFNYYLYPDRHVWYIVMEYVKGRPIDKYCADNPENISSVFEQVIEGFRHLEEIQVLHRDIRPENILVSNDGQVKIIDFGFGKRIEPSKGRFTNSVLSINWRYSTPDEFEEGTYDFSTDAYFVGKMFEEIIVKNRVVEFKYENIRRQMTDTYMVRMGSFSEISRAMLTNSYSELEFSYWEKEAYVQFAKNLTESIASFSSNPKYVNDTDAVLTNLQNIYRDSVLESNVQALNKVINCFVIDSYKYFPKKEFPVSVLKGFLDFYLKLSTNKRKVVLNNLWNRFDAVKRVEVDDLPF